MKTISLLIAGAAIAALVSGPASADVFLKGSEVAALVVGKTIEGQYRECTLGRQDFAEYYHEDGTIRGKERPCNQVGSWKKYGGAWEIKDDKFCVTLGSGRPSGCFNYQVDEKGTLRRVDEKGVTETTFKIYDGNPDHL